jgi:sodium pump decarboxylase gamma subunit
MSASILLHAVMSATDPALINIGMRITFVGMVIVYAGLLVLCFSLPLISRLAQKRVPRVKVEPASADTNDLTKEEVVAVTVAIHSHLTKINRMEDAILTWELYERPYTPWRLAGRSRLLLNRAALRQSNRSR